MRSVNLTAVMIVVAVLVSLAGCGGGGNKGPVLRSISVTPGNSTLSVGATGRFTATGTYSDNSTRDITSLVTWSSSSQGVVTISNATGTRGAATAFSVGSTTVTATLGAITGSTNLTTTPASVPAANVMPLTVNGSLCSAGSYLNKACVSVTICTPDLSVCQTVNDILLDTGSYGLRVFQQAIPNLTLPPVASGAGSLTGCVQFADGSSLWGPIQSAMVKLGNEPFVPVPIQVINSSFGSLPLPCSNADPTPVSSGFAGILGVGVFKEDCGLGCVFTAANGVYYSCTGATCVGTTVPLADQVQNPVAVLPVDNNGLIVSMPSVPIGGVPSLDGSVVLGIGTSTNNTLSGPVVLRTDSTGDFTTVFNGVTTNGFADTGSNGLFFPDTDPGVLPVCPSPNTDWYCPPVTRSLLATNVGATGTPVSNVSFNISNFNTLLSSPNRVFRDIGGPSGFGFDWGLPFFMGRSVAFGIEDETSVLGTGPYVAY
ncbi:DUF3443 family protein [Geomonas subterranea]|uniref:DUF3443 family protein n=1 Tax=Geomonas subterranea TaxID=2847989 RepID=A0ABX8LP59_9BACT|nr:MULTISPECIES: DUF3443 family protein [Geomonas]QXE92033.1 DUF3443 family protein [Geomonas subterranea]QXM09874.1 DUF3443 family protein [Geomonas subterranea]